MAPSTDPANKTNDSSAGAAAPQAPVTAEKGDTLMDVSARSTSNIFMDSSERKSRRSSHMSERPIQLPIASQLSEDTESSLSHMFATKDNSAFKWQRGRGVVGALEVPSEPSFRFKDPLVPRKVKGKEEPFEEALEDWAHLKLRDDFVKSCEKLPSEMCCCGLLSDQDATKRRFVSLLNEGWCKRTNKKLLNNKSGWKVDAFLWNWQNASGKAETNILLIRFIQTSSYRFKVASDQGSVEFELLDQLELDEEEGDFDEDKPTIDGSVPEGATMDR
jgi:hypothetical protein